MWTSTIPIQKVGRPRTRLSSPIASQLSLDRSSSRRSGAPFSRCGNDVAVALLDDFAAARSGQVTRRQNEWFVDASAAPDLVYEASRRDIKVLGLEGFLIGDGGTYPALSRIADFSDDAPEVANRKAIELLTGEWANTPTAADQMSSEASGQHMIAVVLDD
jgi:hypothetical protein